jgi:predicted dehydrogenase
MPNFYDGVNIMRVLEAGIRSSNEGRKVKIAEIV